MEDGLFRSILGGDWAPYLQLVGVHARRVIEIGSPSPEGPVWTEDDVDELVGEFFASTRPAALLDRATSDDSLRALVHTSLRNLVSDRFRRTARGTLQRRLKVLLTAAEYVEHPAGHWRRATDPDRASSVEIEHLVEVVWGVDVAIVRWSPEAKRNGPGTDRASLLRLLESIFDEADGAVELTRLTSVIAQRIGLQALPIAEDIDALEERGALGQEVTSPEDNTVEAEDTVRAQIVAENAWDQLTEEERRVLPHVTEGARAAGAAAGGGKTKAHGVIKRAREKLRQVLIDEPEHLRSQVITDLLDRSREADVPER